MLKKTITYQDYNGETQKEDFFFNLSKAEVVEMNMRAGGKLQDKLEAIAKAEDVPSMYEVLKDIVLRSYGVKSDDGKRFIKNKAMRDEFEQSEAYSELIYSLMTDTDEMIAFATGVIPAVPGK